MLERGDVHSWDFKAMSTRSNHVYSSFFMAAYSALARV